jgi:glycosyltransferase involved in cell wall biosynthesis
LAVADMGQGVFWLDVTRLVSRAGRGVLTGIDRVEHAWLIHLIETGAPETRYILRSTRGYLLLDRRGASLLADMLSGHGVPVRGDMLSRLIGKGSAPRHRVESALRAVAVDRSVSFGLARLLARAAPRRFTYLNLGHSNLSRATLTAFARAPQARVAVLIHDLIPITHPDLVADGMPARFAGRIERVRQSADLVICNSDATKADLARHWQNAPNRPPACVAALGVDAPPRGVGPRDPNHFVMLGTIEPRKNHALMVDVWERLAADLSPDQMPHLHIIGPTGWKVGALMDRLARHPLLGVSIHLHGPLPEDEVQAHLSRAVALLFPSLAEGYGYPPLEAALMGALPICSDLEVLHNSLGNSAVYLNVTDAYSWSETIKKHVLGICALPVLPPPQVTCWTEHFETVTRALAGDVGKGR